MVLFSIIICLILFCRYSLQIDHNRHHKVVDVILFDGEPMGHLRLKYLSDVVDLFVIVEAHYTHTGKFKSQLAMDTNKHWFTELEAEGKILKVVIDKFPFDTNATLEKNPSHGGWKREFYQRDMLATLLLNHFHKQSFIMLSCDCDEIPRKEFVRKLPSIYNKLSMGVRLEMMFFYYSFKWIRKQPWLGSVVLNDQCLRNEIDHAMTLSKMRQNNNLRRVSDAGWHCSYCMAPDRIIAKMNSISEHYLFNENVSTIEWVQHCIENGIDVLNRTGIENEMSVYDGSRGLPLCKDGCSSFPFFQPFINTSSGHNALLKARLQEDTFVIKTIGGRSSNHKAKGSVN
jgi:hypothetical protein